jgi:hypothetical protein
MICMCIEHPSSSYAFCCLLMSTCQACSRRPQLNIDHQSPAVFDLFSILIIYSEEYLSPPVSNIRSAYQKPTRRLYWILENESVPAVFFSMSHRRPIAKMLLPCSAKSPRWRVLSGPSIILCIGERFCQHKYGWFFLRNTHAASVPAAFPLNLVGTHSPSTTRARKPARPSSMRLKHNQLNE